ncbi:MAG: hypothetical protein ACHQ3P_05990 [Candidatus Limnocylindrales bacterium]
MDALPAILSLTLLGALGVVIGRAIAGVPDRHVTGLSSLLGGWRPQTWPPGIQEDDPEAGWARRPEAGWARRPEGRREAIASAVIGLSEDDPMSWIEELD